VKGFKKPEFYLYYGDIAQIKGNWNDASKYFEQAYSYPGVNEMVSAEAFMRYGEMLYRKGEVKDSLGYFEEANSVSKKSHHRKTEARSLNDIGLVAEMFGNISLAEKKYTDAIQIQKNISDWAGIVTSLNNLGSVFDSQGDLKAALEKYKESLKICEDIGDRAGIATSSHNIGTIYEEEKNYFLSLQNLFKSLALNTQMEVKSEETLNYIFGIRKSLGLAKFKELAEQAHNNLSENLKPFLDLKEITKDTTIKHEIPQVGRNDPCPCGSGKKYKKCHGQI